MNETKAQQATSGELTGAMCSRQKHWSEITEAEKVERIREVVKPLQSRIHHLERQLNALMRHQHSATGELLTPMSDYPMGYGENRMRTKADDEVYF